MAQKGTEAQVSNFETKRRKSSHLKSTTHLFRTQARGPHCYPEGCGECLGRPAPASTTQPCRGP